MVEALLWPVGYITGGRTWYHRYPDQATKKKLICFHCCGDGLFFGWLHTYEIFRVRLWTQVVIVIYR